MQIKILWVGKTKNASIRNLFDDYLSRVRHMVSCEIVETRDLSKRRSLRGDKLLKSEAEEMSRFLGGHSRIVALDEKGKGFSSAEFACWLDAEQNKGTREIDFVIGGPEGLDSLIVARSHVRLSLGKMTWTYRALGMLRNIPYHRA